MTERPLLSTRRRLLVTGGAGFLAGCGSRVGSPTGFSSKSPPPTSPPPTTTGPTSSDGTPTTEQDLPKGSPLAANVEPVELITHLNVPWDVTFTPTGELFVSERGGSLLRFETETVLAATNGPLDAREVKEPDRIEWLGESVQGIAVHPEYPEPSLLYAYYTVGTNGRGHNHLGRFDPMADTPEETLEVLVDGIDGGHTIGGRIAFGPTGDLWVTVGTYRDSELAQDRSSIHGSVLRLTPEGDPTPANPTHADGDPRIYSYGHRNPQGLAWLPDGPPLCTEHGPTGRDEIQRLRPGVNYGWPLARNPSEYESHPDIAPPLVNTGPDVTWAPAGCVLYTGDRIPAWRNRLIVATLRGRHINVVTLLPPDAEQPPLDGDARRYDAGWLDGTFTATAYRTLEDTPGRIRNVAQTPDGSLVAMTSNRDGAPGNDEPIPRDRDDMLFRLRPT